MFNTSKRKLDARGLCVKFAIKNYYKPPLERQGVLFFRSLLPCEGNSEIAQSVERRTVNPQVPGSSPGFGAKLTPL